MRMCCRALSRIQHIPQQFENLIQALHTQYSITFATTQTIAPPCSPRLPLRTTANALVHQTMLTFIIHVDIVYLTCFFVMSYRDVTLTQFLCGRG